MRKIVPFIVLLFLVGIVATNGCSPVATPPPTETPVPTPDIASTVEAAVATAVAAQPAPDIAATAEATVATAMAAQPTPDIPATVQAAVAMAMATQAEPTATPEPTDTQTVGPTDTPTSTSTPTDTPTPPPPPPPLLIIYDDALRPGWEDWSWDCRGNFSSAGLVHEGEYAVAVEYEKGWGGLAFGRHASVSTQGYNRVEFWVHGGASGGQLLRVSFNTCKSNCELPPGGLSINNPKYVEDGIISPDAWKLVSVPLADLGAVDVSIVKFNIMDNSGSAQPTFYIDDVVLVKK